VSVIVLGEPTRPVPRPQPHDVTRFRTPRREMGWQAADHLTELVGGAAPIQKLLACELIEGATLTEVPKECT
jgi:DNA-binding LacI/PurR family transcriptional regulator